MKTHSNTPNWIELFGGKIVDMLPYEPDPNSFHSDFYYNTGENKLYKLIKRFDAVRKLRTKHWIGITQEY
jgi:hypothetical protein